VKQSKDIRWAEVQVGLLLVGSLVFLAIGIFLVGEKTRLFTPTIEVSVLLPNVQGLKAGAPVWLSGVVIGTVADIAFSEPLRSDQVTVTLAIDAPAARRLGPDAVVTVKTRGLVGEKYIDITPGTRFGLLPDVPLQGIAPTGLDEAVLQAHSAFQRLDRMIEAFEGGDGSLSRLVNDPALYDNLTHLSERLQKVLTSMTEGEGSLAKIITDPQLYQKMVDFSAQGEAAALKMEQFVTSMQDPGGTLARLAHDPALYDESLETVRRARLSLAEADALLLAIREGKGTAGKLISEAELHDQLARTLANLDALVRDMKENPGRYVKFSLF
jgi:phospholipid/cholesterol/gamma-HCH transport system substrate-binding protein